MLATVQQQLNQMMLDALSLSHDRHGDCKQAVLLPGAVGAKLPALLWPKGTVIYLLGTAEAHKEARAEGQVSSPKHLSIDAF
jgi:hypothetical protein